MLFISQMPPAQRHHFLQQHKQIMEGVGQSQLHQGAASSSPQPQTNSESATRRRHAAQAQAIAAELQRKGGDTDESKKDK